MKKSLLILAIFGLFSLSMSAQQRAHCWTTENNQPLIQNDPQYQRNLEDLEKFTEKYAKDQRVNRSGTRQLYIIPVVFHILHNYGPENVSDDIIRESMIRINKDYRKLNADTFDIIPSFQGIAADCEIEFRLATIDPVGNCTNGIEHIPTLETYNANDSSKRSPTYMYWPTNKYLNVWVAHDLENAGAAAYAHLPGGAANTDGIMCWYTYVDNVSHTLTHEFGHHFNLLHVWGGTNQPGVACGDDGVSDTPITMGWDHCPQQNQAKVCDPNVTENYQNFMEYSYCDNMFTQGQKTRMYACLNNGTSGRNNLWTPANLLATGTQDGAPSTVCIPKADFKAENYSACTNQSVQFIDQSWNAHVTSWSWSFPGGTPSVSNDSNPTVVYPNAGTFDVTLIASTSAGSDTITKSSIIHVSGAATTAIPYIEDFESGPSSFPGTDGWVENTDGGPINWSLVTNASAGAGTNCIKINNYSNTIGYTNRWITPSIDFTGITFPITIAFKVSHAQRNANTEDELKLMYSIDCGKNWANTSYDKTGSNLSSTGTYSTSSYTPTNASQWRQETVTVNPVQNKPQVRFKFENVSGRGNNIYIDEINMTGVGIGINENEDLSTALFVFPNPTTGSSTVDFSLSKNSEVSLDVKDIIGNNIASVLKEVSMEAGPQQMKLPVLAAGIYMVDLTVNKRHHFIRLIVS